MYAIVGEVSGQQLYWSKTRWAKRLSSKCLFDRRQTADRTISGQGSIHWHTLLDDGTHVENVRVIEASG